jgi:hypothetical protein
VDDLPVIELRRIEASVIKPIYEEMVRTLGREQAREILGKAIERDAIAHGARLAEALEGPADIAGFAALLPNWQKEDALKIEVLEQSGESFDFNVTRCRYSEMYRDMGLGEIGDLLSCNRDGAFCTGFNPDIEMTRTQTIMKGAAHCDFRYKDKSGSGG